MNPRGVVSSKSVDGRPIILLLLWILLAVSFLAVYTLDLRLSYPQIAEPCEGPGCHYQALTDIEARALADLGLPVKAYARYLLGLTVLTVVMFIALAGIMLVRLYPQRKGFLFSLMIVAIPVTAITSFDVVIEAYPAWTFPIALLFFVGQALIVLFFLVFPTGRLEPRWTAILPLAVATIAVFGVFNEGIQEDIWLPLLFFFILAAIIAVVVYRYRRIFSPTERRQTKWVILGMIVFFLGVPMWGYTFEWSNPAAGMPQLITVVGGWTITNLLSLALPVAIFVAILRYRLWDIDLIVRRTLVYGSLTVLLAGIYVASVFLLQRLFTSVTGQGSSITIVLSTLIIAALFQPLRVRLQRGVNRLFFGQRDDPYAVLSELGQRLQESATPSETLSVITNTIREALKLPYAAILVEAEDSSLATVVESGRKTSQINDWPLRYQGQLIGWLAAAPRSVGEEFSDKEDKLLGDIASQTGAAAYSARLTRHLQHAREQLVLAREEERRRIRRDLHDGLGPDLASQTFKLDTAIELLDDDPSTAVSLLRGLKDQNQELVAKIRRLVYALRPPTLDELGLGEALNMLAQQIDGRSSTYVSIEAQPGIFESLPAAVEVALYRLVQEALSNMASHAQASTCTVECLRDGDWISLVIRDDGIGIPKNVKPGVGLNSMHERVEELGGTITIESREPSGTKITAFLPTDDHHDGIYAIPAESVLKGIDPVEASLKSAGADLSDRDEETE